MRSMASTSGSAFSEPVVNTAAIAPKACRVGVLYWFYINTQGNRYVLSAGVFFVKPVVVVLSSQVLAGVVVVDPVQVAFGEECVAGWLRGLGKDARNNYRSNFKDWLKWVWKQPGWAGKRPSELLDFQEAATGRMLLFACPTQ